MSSEIYFQELAKKRKTSIKHIAHAGEFLHMIIGGEEVPDNLVPALSEWITKNLVVGFTSLVKGDNSFVLNMVSQGEAIVMSSMNFDRLHKLPATTQQELDEVSKDILALAGLTEKDLIVYCEMTGCSLPSVNACYECNKAICRDHSHPSISDDERDIIVCSMYFYGYTSQAPY